MIPVPGEHSAVLKSSLVHSLIRARCVLATSISLASGTSDFFFTRVPTGSPSFAKFQTLYDQFKINGMRISLTVPKLEIGVSTIGSSPAGLLTNGPSVVQFTYDNDAAGVVSYANAAGYDNLRRFSPTGMCAYAVKHLPPAMMAGSTLTGGAVMSSEWCDCAYATNVYGGVTMSFDRAFSGTWGVAPTLLNQVTILVEYDVTFRSKFNQ